VLLVGEECSMSLSDSTASVEDKIDVTGSVDEDRSDDECGMLAVEDI